MGSWIKCLCGMLIHTNMFCGTPVYMLVKDSDYDALDNNEEPEAWNKAIDRSKVEDLFLHKGTPVYQCTHCGRLVVEWKQELGPMFYLPELKVEDYLTDAEEDKSDQEPSALSLLPAGAPQWEPLPEPLGEKATDDERRLRELEVMADAAYTAMYDAINPEAHYAEVKDILADAIALARKMRRETDLQRLQNRLAFVKAVFRNQFPC